MVDLVHITDENITVRNSSGQELFNTDNKYLMYTDISSVSSSGVQKTPIVLSRGDQSSLDLLRNYGGYANPSGESAGIGLTQYANRNSFPSSTVVVGTFKGPFPSLPAVFFYQPSQGQACTVQRASAVRTLTLQNGTIYGTYRWVVSKIIGGPGAGYSEVFPEIVNLVGITPTSSDVLTLVLHTSDIYNLVSSSNYVNTRVHPYWYDYPNQVLNLGVTT